MYDANHENLLKEQGVEAWNAWRKQNPGVDPGLYNVDLSKRDLRGADLRGADLRGASLTNANLSDTNLSDVNLSDVKLIGADLRGADLRGAASITNEELEQQASSLEGATMPDGQLYEEW